MPRILFEKTGDAVWISHLDLMRLFQRAFKRAGLPLTHTKGFNPRPSVSIALPLSVGIESHCELLDFDLEGEQVSCEEIADKLNAALIPGVHVLKVYEQMDKLKNLALLSCRLELEYDDGIPAGAVEAMNKLFSGESVVVEKRGKNGPVDQDIAPMIRKLKIREADSHVLHMDAVVCCQNPTLNPTQLYAAVEKYLPEYKASFVKCCRLEVYDTNEKVFR